MREVEVYGGDHSPWVQAVLLGIHEAQRPHTIRGLPPWNTFKTAGVMMPAARISGGAWQLESTEILVNLGFAAVSDEELGLVRAAWQGVLHRADSAALFWGAFSTTGDRSDSALARLAVNAARPFITLYFYLLIRTFVHLARPKDPDDFAAQFLPFETRLAESGDPYLCGGAPNTLDFLLFGIVQCHASIYVPPIAALQTDARLAHVRAWIASMQERFSDYQHLYSGAYFQPHSARPRWPSGLERVAFWLGTAVVVAAFPITVPAVALLAIRNQRRRR